MQVKDVVAAQVCRQGSAGVVQATPDDVACNDPGWVRGASDSTGVHAVVECRLWSQMDLSLNPAFLCPPNPGPVPTFWVPQNSVKWAW